MRYKGKVTYSVEIDFDIDESWFGWDEGEGTPTRDDVENELFSITDVSELEGNIFHPHKTPKIELVDVVWTEDEA